MKTNMTNANILKAAALIAELDTAGARFFISHPFHRHGFITAFHKSLLKSKSFAHIADETAVYLRQAVDQVSNEIQLAAANQK